MKTWDDWSDFELNKAVMERLYPGKEVHQLNLGFAEVVIFCEEILGGSRIIKNYCNNPADMWPIIVDNRIEIQWHQHGYCLAIFRIDGDNLISSGLSKYPLRAAAIVFLIMHGVKP